MPVHNPSSNALQRLPYEVVARAIAMAKTDEDRARAGQLVVAHYSVMPPLQETRECMKLLLAALKAEQAKSSLPT